MKDFVPYKESLELKALGFDEPCIKYYWTDGMFTKTYESPFNHNKRDNLISAPTFSQVFKWFRERYKLMSSITPCSDGEYIFTLYDLNKCDLEVFVEDIEIMESEESYEFFEKAELECLKKLIKIVKNDTRN